MTVITLSGFDSLVRIATLAGLCAFGTASAATRPPAAKPKAATAKAARAAKKPVAKAVEVAPADASAEQIEAADKVFYGAYDCEFNQKVDIEKNAKHAAYVDVKAGKSLWTMKPVLSSTGAIRLEDIKGETLMVQISSKSMLLNVKSAQRIVDDCVSPKQRELIAEAKAAKAAAEAGTGAATASTSTLK